MVIWPFPFSFWWFSKLVVQSKTVWGGCPGIGGVAGNVVVQTDTHALLMAPPSLLMCISPPHCSRSTFMPVVGSIEFVMGLLKKCKLRQVYLVARSDFSFSKDQSPRTCWFWGNEATKGHPNPEFCTPIVNLCQNIVIFTQVAKFATNANAAAWWPNL